MNSSASIIDTGRKKFSSLLMSTGSQRKTNSGMDAAVSPWLATRLVTTGMSVFVTLPRTAMWACSSPQSAPPIRGGRDGTGAKLLLDVLFYFSSFGSIDDCNARWWVWTWVALAVRLVPLRAWHQNPPSSQLHPSSIADHPYIILGVCFSLK